MSTANEKSFFSPFRVIVEFDKNHQVFVGRCLETGSVVTADDPETADRMIMEVLVDEVEFAIKHKNFANLFSSPAPPDVFVRWRELTKETKPDTVFIKMDARELKLDEDEVSNEIQLVRAA